MRILALGGIRRGMGAVIDPTTVEVAAVQCGINRNGGSVDVDGYFGPQTRTSLTALANAFRIAGGDEEPFADPGNDATRIVLSSRFRAWLIGGTMCERETGPSGPPPSSSSGSAPVVRSSAKFWRRDNWKAWGVAALIAAGLGVGGAYLATKPKRKRSKS